MIPHPTQPEQALRVARYGVLMQEAGLPTGFVGRVIRSALEDQGVFELMELWVEAESDLDRGRLVADLQTVLDEGDEAALRSRPDGGAELKLRLRALIDRHGGVSAVARKMGVAQPSLSRMLTSDSVPRRTTLHRLARALGVEESEVLGTTARASLRPIGGRRSASNDAADAVLRERLMAMAPLERVRMSLRLYARTVAIADRLRGKGSFGL